MTFFYYREVFLNKNHYLCDKLPFSFLFPDKSVKFAQFIFTKAGLQP